ncbi:MAG: type II glyceraldehyde-3-phosphate dehydrogenase [Candidatus Aenigmarchaeota archaeon]|jgi:glyceraldehyde-3-phosphate dehydrogenase (NAD(P))|nr:type II glyceraldehyde-3-phosphate dehydrogenase [Candidatus Aenigmarchaeota archaeon]
MINVAVHGIGTIGKRIAHAIKLQKDMRLRAIVGYSPDSTIKTVLEPQGPLYGTDLYATNEESLKKFKEAKMIVNGTLEDLLKKGEIDVIIDATPEGLGKEYRDKYYSKYNVKAIFQGGEDADVAEMTFNAVVNYEKAFGKKFVRVPSCNTTGLIRTLSAIEKFGIAYVFVAVVRRAADPHEHKKGPINAIEFEEVPSHHGEDVRTVMSNLNIFTMAVKVPTTLAHTHIVETTLMKRVSKEEIIKAFEDQTRVILLDMKEYPATSKIIEKFRDYCRPRNDMYEIVVLRDSISVEGNKVRWMQVVHQEADVIPENIDAIRAITGIEKDKWRSIKMTNESLGILK